jgi:AcrR family transcriptional regulator
LEHVVVVREIVSPIALQRKERVRAMMREDILAAARSILKDQGYSELSMRALGRAAGITAPTIYDYFSGKEAVLDALFADGADMLADEMKRAAAAAEPGAERLQAIGTAYRRFAIENPDLYLLLFGGADPSYTPSESLIEKLHHVSDLAAEAVQEAMDVGYLKPGSSEDVSNSMWVMAHGSVMLELKCFRAKFDENGGDEFFRLNMRFLFEGLGSGNFSAP